MKTALILTAAFLAPVAASAQTVVLYEPVVMPIEYNDAGLIKAQHIKPGDVTPEEYARLLEEADKVRAFQGNSQPSYTIVDNTDATPQMYVSPESSVQSYESTTTYEAYNAAPSTTVTSTLSHTVVKGDTLYNLAKRNGVSVDTLRQTNGLTSNALSLGQTLLIPSSTPMTTSTTIRTVEPTSAYNAYTETVLAVAPAAPTIITGSATSKPYAVVPGDTLYSISRRACVSVASLQGANGLSGNNISPGQKLALPSGHCLR